MPISFTTHYNLGKWNDGDNPGAAALNNNWDVIDTKIHDVSVIAQNAYTSSLSQSLYVSDPIYRSGSNAVITLRYDTGSFTIVSGSLKLSASFAQNSGSFTGSFSGSFFGQFTGSISGSDITGISSSFSYVSSSVVRTEHIVATTGSFNYLDIQEANLTGVSSSFTINASAADIDQMLTLERTTGGAAIVTWNGTQVGLNKVFKPIDLALARISQTEPSGTVAGQIWLEVIP
jgi:hypothetical protein